MKQRSASQQPLQPRSAIKSIPKQQFFAIKNAPKRLKASHLFTEQSTPHKNCRLNSPQTLTVPRQYLSIQRKNKNNQLVSTFGSDHFLTFKSTPLKRKRNKRLGHKKSLQFDFVESSAILSSKSLFSSHNFSTKQRELFPKRTRIVYQRRQWRLEDFIFLEKIGSGTYSQVFKVVEKRTGFVCSLKVLNKQQIKKMQVEQNVLKEIKISFFLNHPNIFTLYGCFSDEIAIYLIGELATDYSLYDALCTGKSNGKKGMPAEIVKNYIGQLCDALQYMHENMILHRDIKPQNMLITFTTTLKLCDFGWSTYNPDKSLRSTLCGTPLYLAPELIKQTAYNESIDVWALGVITYELLTGDIPFKIRSLQDLSKVVTQEINCKKIQDPQAVDFIQSATKKKQEERKTIRQICHHPFLKSYHQQKQP